MVDPSESSTLSKIPSEQISALSPGGVSRRTVLKRVAAMGAGAALSIHPVLAAMSDVDSNPKRGRVDVHHHMLPPF